MGEGAVDPPCARPPSCRRDGTVSRPGRKENRCRSWETWAPRSGTSLEFGWDSRAAKAHAIIVIVVAGALWAGTTPAQTTSAEQKCMAGTSKALTKLLEARHKCVSKCWTKHRKGRVPASDCMPPYGGDTAACLTADPKGADAKARAQIAQACAADCPECYGGGDCATEGPARVEELAAGFDDTFAGMYCDDSTSPDGHTAAGIACQDAATKNMVKAIASITKCWDQCRQAVFKGTLPPGGHSRAHEGRLSCDFGVS